ncbi:MAG: hypothetical protein P4L84_01800 [Isosphaeraceae bacterium]|nr:hypothetical protein [Isosphaeraceae bacterium]
MLRTGKVSGFVRTVAVGALLGLGVAADAPTQTVSVGQLSFEAPGSWKSVKPRSQMIQTQLTIAPAQGDEDPAEFTVSAFAGGGGGIDANIKRWQSQFKDAGGNEPKLDRKTVKGKNVDVVRAETAGHYYPPPFTRLPDKADYRLLGAIVQTDDAGYYLKLIGPEKTISAARPAFDKMLATIKAGEK